MDWQLREGILIMQRLTTLMKLKKVKYNSLRVLST